MQSNGNLIVDGVVQITVAHLGHNSIDPDRVPELMRSVSNTLIECIKDAAAAFPGDVVTTVAAIPASAPAVGLPAPAKANNVVPMAPTAAKSAPASPKATAPAPTEVAPAPKAAEKAAEQKAPATTAAAPAKASAPAKAKATSVAARFAHLPKKPAVPIDESITQNGIICLFDGESRRMLHRYLKSKYGMTPEEYRDYWKLPKDYQMTAPGYSEEKRIVAVAQGLGTTKQTRNTKKRAQAAAKARQRQSA